LLISRATDADSRDAAEIDPRKPTQFGLRGWSIDQDREEAPAKQRRIQVEVHEDLLA
jgi:hypothetical protein